MIELYAMVGENGKFVYTEWYDVLNFISVYREVNELNLFNCNKVLSAYKEDLQNYMVGINKDNGHFEPIDGNKFKIDRIVKVNMSVDYNVEEIK